MGLYSRQEIYDNHVRVGPLSPHYNLKTAAVAKLRGFNLMNELITKGTIHKIIMERIKILTLDEEEYDKDVKELELRRLLDIFMGCHNEG